MKAFRSSRVREAGHTLSEILVAITLFVVVSAITGALIVNANQTTRRATSAAVAQSQLQDTVLRMSREVAVSDPIVSAKPTQLETLTVRGTSTVRTRFWYKEIDTANKTGEIRSKEAIAPAFLPVNNDAITGFKVVAQNVKEEPTAPQGSSARTILAYVDGDSNPVGDGVLPLTTSELKQVARVKINLNATVKDRDKPLTLVTSMATRLGKTPAGGPPPALPDKACPVPTTPGREATQMTWSWGGAPYAADNIKIDRILISNGSRTINTVPVAATPWTDSPLAPAEAYFYEFTWTGPLGPSQMCSYKVDPMPLPLAPVLGAYPAGYSNNMVKWNAPAAGDPAVDHYVVSRSATATGTFTDVPGTVTGTTWSDTDAAVRAKIGSTSWYKVRAFQTSDATRPSPLSNANVAVQYPVSPVTAAVVAGVGGLSSGNSADTINHIAWGNVPSATKYQVNWAQKNNFAPTKLPGAVVAVPGVNYYDHTSRPMGSRFEYFVVGLNGCHNDVLDVAPFNDPQAGVDCESRNVVGGPDTPTLETQMAQIYQRPAAPDPTVTAYPKLYTNLTGLELARNGDAGNLPAAPFCDTVVCGFEMSKSLDGATYTVPSGTEKPAGGWDAVTKKISLTPYLREANDGGDWGHTFDWKVRTSNPGGWSNTSAADRTLTFPSVFSVVNETRGLGMRQALNGSLILDQEYSRGITWGPSYGLGLQYQYRPDNAAALTSYGTAMTSSNSVVLASSIHTWTVNARAANGLVRPLLWTVQSHPATIKSQTTRAECKLDAWRLIPQQLNTRSASGLPPEKSYYRWNSTPFDTVTQSWSMASGVVEVPADTISGPHTNVGESMNWAVFAGSGVSGYNFIKKTVQTPAVDSANEYSYSLGLGFGSPGVLFGPNLPLDPACQTYGATFTRVPGWVDWVQTYSVPTVR